MEHEDQERKEKLIGNGHISRLASDTKTSQRTTVSFI